MLCVGRLQNGSACETAGDAREVTELMLRCVTHAVCVLFFPNSPHGYAMSGRSQKSQTGPSPETTENTSLLGSVSGLVGGIGNSALNDLMFGGGNQAACVDQGPEAVERPRPDTEEAWSGATKGMLIGAFVGGPVGAALGYGLGTAVDLLSADQANTGLGSEVDDLVDASPVLKGALDKAQKAGWTIEYGVSGEGTYADPNTQTIRIDPDDKGNVAELANSLAHELGHANYEVEPFIPMAGLTKDEFVRQNTYRELRGEAEATILELEVRDDLLSSDTGIDSGVSGATGDQKKALWEEHKAGQLSRAELVEKIADLFATGETTGTSNENYYDYYSQTFEQHWDANNP